MGLASGKGCLEYFILAIALYFISSQYITHTHVCELELYNLGIDSGLEKFSRRSYLFSYLVVSIMGMEV